MLAQFYVGRDETRGRATITFLLTIDDDDIAPAVRTSLEMRWQIKYKKYFYSIL